MPTNKREFLPGSDPALAESSLAVAAARQAVTRSAATGQVAQGRQRATSLLGAMGLAATATGQTMRLRVKAPGSRFPVLLDVPFLQSMVDGTLCEPPELLEFGPERRAGYSDELFRTFMQRSADNYHRVIRSGRHGENDLRDFWHALDRSLSSGDASVVLISRADGTAAACRLSHVAALAPPISTRELGL